MSQQNKKADLNKAVTLYTKRLLNALTEGNPVEQEEVDALNEMREAAGMKPLAIAITTQGKAAPAQKAPQPERKPPQSAPKPSGGGKQFRRQQDAEAEGAENVSMVPISVGGNQTNAHLMEDNANWTNRFMIRSESSNALYTIAQNKSRRYWGCNCPGWIGHRKCKHLRALGLPPNEQPYEAKLDKGASVKNSTVVKFADEPYSELAHVLAAELIHSDAELSKMMEPATSVVDGVPGVAHIDGPEAGPSNDEMHANQHEENGVPVTDGNLVSPERQNVTAIKDAIEGKAEMEIGKPIAQKQEEVDLATEVRDEKLMNPGATQEVSAKPGTQIIINVGSKQAAYVGFDDLTSAGKAVMQRIKATKPELVFEYGYDRVLEAAYEATASLTNLEEIGSSDVSIWTKRVEEDLAHSKQGAEGIGGENQSGATNDGAGGMFGGTDLEGPSFHVGFDFRGSRREASFTSLSEANKFTKAASAKFGKMAGNWTMKCPSCGGQASKNSPEDNYTCACGWNSHTAVSERETMPKKASAKKAKEIKQVAPDPAFVEAMVNAVLIDHGARAMELQIPLARLVSIIKTKIKKVTRGNTATISIYIPESDTEYVMQLPKEQAEQGNYKFNPGMDPATGLPKNSASDPAKRNLVLELLKGGRRLTTGEIEKSLGGGKYTNNAYPVLTELAKEGLVAHKQMRWSLKTAERTVMPVETTKQTPGAYGYDPAMKTQPIAEDPMAKGAPSWVTGSKKSYRIKSAGPLPSSFSIETRMSEGHPLAGDAGIKTIADQLNQIYADLKRIDPPGYKDSFEAQLPSRMMDIATKHGVTVEHNPSDNTFTFFDQAGASTKGQKHEDLKESAVNPHTGDPARPEAFDHKQQVKEQPIEEDDWTRNYDEERDHKSYTSSLKAATIRITSARPAPSKGSPEWHQIQVAIGSLKAPDAMLGVMGGPSKEEALEILAQYGMRWDDADYMAGGKGVKKAGDGMAKTVEVDKEAGFNFFFPGQVLKEFYPEVQHEIVDYPNANNQPMGLESPEIVGDGGHELEGILDEALNPSVIEMIQLPADISDVEPLAMAAADYSSTSPAGGMGIGRDGKPEVLEGAPLRKENDVRGYMFTDEFYGQYEGVPGAAMQVASKTAADGTEQKQFSLFLKKVCGEIAATMVAAFKVTSRPLLDKVPGIGELQLDVIEQGTGMTMPAGQTTQGGRVKYLMGKLNDGDIKQAINDAWAQAAVWNDNSEGGFVYEVFVRPETIDTDSLVMKYKFIAGTRE
jgi:hypothetical protein